MSRRSFGSTMRMIAREAARAERARQQAQMRQHAANIRGLRDAERQAKADAKEAARLHIASQLEEAEELTIAVRERDEAINSLLARALTANPTIDLKATLKVFQLARFDEPRWNLLPPEESHFAPNPPGFFARLVPGAAGRHERRMTQGKLRFREATGGAPSTMPRPRCGLPSIRGERGVAQSRG